MHEHCLGRIVIDRIEADLVFGQFTPGPGFARVEPLFVDYDEVANEQLFSTVGALDDAIAALGLHLRAADRAGLPAIHDVQIGEGVITFRPRPPPQAPDQQNGAVGLSTPASAILPPLSTWHAGLGPGDRFIQARQFLQRSLRPLNRILAGRGHVHAKNIAGAQ